MKRAPVLTESQIRIILEAAMPDEPMIPRRTYEQLLHDHACTVEALHFTIMRMEDGLRQIRDIANELLTVKKSEPEK